MLFQDTAAAAPATTPAPDAAPAAGFGADWVPLLTTHGLNVAAVIVILAVAWVLSGWVRRAIEASLVRAKLDVTIAKFLANVAKYAILVFAIIACLNRFGINTTSLAAVIGAAGLAIGLALQGSLANIAAGIMLLIFRPFKVGDVVNVAGHSGTVDEIELFFTRLDTPDNRRIILPNSSIFGSTIENITHHPRRRIDLTVGVAYSADTDRTREVLTRAVASVPGRLDEPAPAVILAGLAESSVNWTVLLWARTSEFGKVREGALRAIKAALDEAGIGIPYRTMDINIVSKTPSGAPLPGDGQYTMASPR